MCATTFLGRHCLSLCIGKYFPRLLPARVSADNCRFDTRRKPDIVVRISDRSSALSLGQLPDIHSTYATAKASKSYISKADDLVHIMKLGGLHFRNFSPLRLVPVSFPISKNSLSATLAGVSWPYHQYSMEFNEQVFFSNRRVVALLSRQVAHRPHIESLFHFFTVQSQAS